MPRPKATRKAFIDPYVMHGPKRGKIHAGFMGYTRKGGQFLHYEVYTGTIAGARSRVAQAIRAHRSASHLNTVATATAKP